MSVRALRHYDEIGLLSPSGRTESGYRWYAAEDIARLQRIKALKQMGFSLAQIHDLLDRSAVSPQNLVDDQLRRLREHIAWEQRLCDRLVRLAQRLSSAEAIAPEDFIDVIEVMSMVERSERYYTPEQREWLKGRARTVGEDRIREVEAEWPRLIAQVRAEMDRGADPEEEQVQGLAARWRDLVAEFTGGNPEIEASLRAMYAREPDIRERTGIDPALSAYIGKALAVGE